MSWNDEDLVLISIPFIVFINDIIIFCKFVYSFLLLFLYLVNSYTRLSKSRSYNIIVFNDFGDPDHG